VYDLENTKTNKNVKVRFGREERSVRLEFVSNGPFTDKEFVHWNDKMMKDGLAFPTRSYIENKKRDIEHAKNYRLTDTDIEFKLKEKERFNSNPKNYAVKKTQLLKIREQAEQMGDEVEATRVQEELDQLEAKAKVLDQKRTNSIAAIAYLNEKNRHRNIADAEKAIMEESAREAANKTDDPFRRRQCAPQLYGTRKKKDVKEDGVVNQEDGVVVKQEDSKEGILNNHSIGLEAKQEVSCPLNSNSTESSPVTESVGDDLFSAHDFDIQIDFEIPKHSGGILSSSSQNTSSAPDVKPVMTNRKSLNFDEYKRKRGLI